MKKVQFFKIFKLFRYSFIDIFSCKDFDVTQALKWTLEVFQPSSYKMNVVERGHDFPR